MTKNGQAPEWTTIDRYFHPIEAHIAAGRLESAGIPIFLLGINHASANWIISNALGGIRLQVPREFVDDAKEILSEGDFAVEAHKECPKCGSTNSSTMTNSRKVAFVAVHLLNIPLPWQDTRRHCDSCGNEWICD